MSIMPRLAAFVATLSPRLATVMQGSGKTAKTTASFGSAQYTFLTLKSDGQAPDLTLRAHRLHNRDQKAAAVYLRKHLILSRGACYEGR